MEIFSKLRQQEVEKREYNPSWLQTLTSVIMAAGSKGTTATRVDEQNALTVSAVYSAVKLLSELTASLPIEFKEKEDNDYFKVVTKGKISDVLLKPNGFQTMFTCMQTMIAQTLLRGNSYAFKYENFGEIQVIPIPQNKYVEVLVSPEGDKVFYRVGGQTFSSDEFIHFKGMTIDGYLGLSPISYASLTIRNSIDSNIYMSKVFESGIQASGFFQTAERLTDKVYARLQQDIKDKSGLARAGEAQILEQGLKFERNTISAADTQIIENMKFGVEEVARIYRIPKHLLYQDSTSSTKSSTQTLEFLNYSLSSLLKNIETELESKLFMPTQFTSRNFQIRFNVNSLLRVAPEERVKFYKGLFDIGAITSNEIRAKEGLPPIDGGDQSFVQLNLAPLDMIDQVIADKINKQINSTNG